MQEQNLSLADGMMMRSLVNFPGGLELHIGVRLLPAARRCSEELKCSSLGRGVRPGGDLESSSMC